MYAGRAVEFGPARARLRQPLHPYTWGLLESLPRLDRRVERLVPIEGSPPSLIHLPPGCPFHPRCPHRFDPCDVERPELRERGGGHLDACHLSIEESGASAIRRETEAPAASAQEPT